MQCRYKISGLGEQRVGSEIEKWKESTKEMRRETIK